MKRATIGNSKVTVGEATADMKKTFNAQFAWDLAPVVPDRRLALIEGLVLRHLDRFPGHAQIQCHKWCAIDERNYPLEKVTEAYDRMMSGKARFRVVLKMG
jgi:hypothetical protein